MIKQQSMLMVNKVVEYIIQYFVVMQDVFQDKYMHLDDRRVKKKGLDQIYSM